MTIHINDIINPALLGEMIAGGYIRTRTHDTLPLTLYSYTEKAQYERVWNQATTQCRGLIVDHHGIVQARPFPKFWNHNEPEAGELDLDAPVEVADKMDGSLGIGFVYNDEFVIATRGSFHSEQAAWATRYWNQTEIGKFSTPNPHYTYLFEIIYPQNRIVLDYGGREDLALLAIIETATGEDSDDWRDPMWPGAIAEVFPYSTLREALTAPPRENAEGFVIRNLRTGQRIKAKFEWYVALHKIVTGLTERSVWEALVGDTWDEFAAAVPDEFFDWCDGVASKLSEAYTDLYVDISDAHQKILARVDVTDRKAYAMEAAKRPDLRPYLFLLLDNNKAKLEQAIWKALRPSGDTFMNTTAAEEAAA